MTTQHTPSPWWVDDEGFIAAGSGETYTTVADPHCGAQDIDERESNARLIAAAPDMLAALQHVLNRATMPGFLRDEVKAAIARATGA